MRARKKEEEETNGKKKKDLGLCWESHAITYAVLFLFIGIFFMSLSIIVWKINTCFSVKTCISTLVSRFGLSFLRDNFYLTNCLVYLFGWQIFLNGNNNFGDLWQSNLRVFYFEISGKQTFFSHPNIDNINDDDR